MYAVDGVGDYFLSECCRPGQSMQPTICIGYLQLGLVTFRRRGKQLEAIRRPMETAILDIA